MNLNQVTVAVRDIERSVAFYRALGLTLVVHAPHYARLVCPDGRATFSVHRVDGPGDGPIASSTVVYFECAELDATVARLVSAGIAFDTPPTDQPWLWREARVSDPDGNPLCLYHAGSNRLDPPWKVEPTTSLA